MNITEEYIVAMSDSLLAKGNCEQLDQAMLDHQESTPTKSIVQDSHKHEEEYP